MATFTVNRDGFDSRKPSGGSDNDNSIEPTMEDSSPGLGKISLHDPTLAMSCLPQSTSSVAASTTTLELPLHRQPTKSTSRRTLGTYTSIVNRHPVDVEAALPLNSNREGDTSISHTSQNRRLSTQISMSTVSHKGPRLCDFVEDMVAISSSELEKYEKIVVIEKHTYEELYIEPLLFLDEVRKLPDGWKAFINPDGAPYFINSSMSHNDSSFAFELVDIVTDVYMYDKQQADRLENYIQKVFAFVRDHLIELPQRKLDLVLEFRQSQKCGYYFADHERRSLFWLDDFDALGLCEVKVLLSPSHVAHEMTAFYWMHIEYFPHSHTFGQETLSELKEMVIHAFGDTITSTTSTSPYDTPTLEKILSLIRNLEEDPSSTLAPACMSVIARLLYNFNHERFLNLYGERNARLERTQSIHPEPQKSYIIKLFSPLFLYGPEVHLRKLQQMSVDSLVHTPNWKILLEKLTDEWKEFTLYATVVLNANVAFLAIQSVDESAPEGGRSSAQRASYLSIVTSVGAIVLGLLLVREHNTMLDRSFLANRSASVYGLETMALMYSLPYALLMWSMIAFLVAFSIMCYESGDLATRIILSIGWPIIASLVVWCISASYENKEFLYPWPFRDLAIVRRRLQKRVNFVSGKLRVGNHGHHLTDTAT